MIDESSLHAILAELDAQAQLYASAADVLRALYGLPAGPVTAADPTTDEPIQAPPAAVDPPVRTRPRKDAAAPAETAPGSEAAPKPGKYDAGILRALRSEQGQYGLPTGDITRLAMPGVKREPFSSVNSSVDYALRRLQTLGVVTREGRIWKVAQ